jgi:hypothetical protein
MCSHSLVENRTQWDKSTAQYVLVQQITPDIDIVYTQTKNHSMLMLSLIEMDGDDRTFIFFIFLLACLFICLFCLFICSVYAFVCCFF